MIKFGFLQAEWPAVFEAAGRAWLAKWERLSDELSAALPAGGSIVEEMNRDRDRRC